MKIVCMCWAGNNRSGALAYLLKHPPNGGHDAVAIGCGTAGPELKELLFTWADYVVVMEGHMNVHVPGPYRHKLLTCEVGPDIWSTPRHPDLLTKVQAFIDSKPFEVPKAEPVQIPRVKMTCICPTYGRAPKQLKLLQEAVYWFGRQTYQNKELIILNDCPFQTLLCFAPDVRVVNHSTRYATLGEKYDALVEMADDGIIVPWEDDDISLPNRLDQARKVITGNATYFNPQQTWYEEGGVLHSDHKHGVCHNASAFTKEAWKLVGGYGKVTGSQDAAIDSRLKSHQSVGKTNALIRPMDWTYIYRWGVSPWHLSGHKDMVKAYQDAPAEPCIAVIEPVMGRNYQEEVAQLLQKIT